MKIIAYAQQHPVASGAVVIIGGILFILIVRGGGGNSASADPSRPSDAEIAANAAIAAAQIQANAAAGQAGAAVQAATIGAGVQMNSDNKAAEVAMRQLDVYKELGLHQMDTEAATVTSVYNQQAAAQQQRTNAIIGSLGKLKKKNRDDVLQALITGQTYTGAPGSNTAQIIGAVGGAAGNVASALTSIFSDARLKENIKHIGFDRKGRDVYEYNYKGSNKRRIGYMAQSLERSEPHLVTTGKTGYKRIPAPVIHVAPSSNEFGVA